MEAIEFVDTVEITVEQCAPLQRLMAFLWDWNVDDLTPHDMRKYLTLVFNGARVLPEEWYSEYGITPKSLNYGNQITWKG